MPSEIVMPVMGESVTEATVGRWLKQEGDLVTVGEPLVELETDKVNTELSAEDAGVLESILRKEGETVHPGETLAVIGTADGAAKPAPAPAATAAPIPPASSGPSTFNLQPSTPEAPENGEVRATPLAERVAEQLHVDLSRVPASGAGGKVVRNDVESFARHGEPQPAPEGAAPATATAAPAPSTPSTFNLQPSTSEPPPPTPPSTFNLQPSTPKLPSTAPPAAESAPSRPPAPAPTEAAGRPEQRQRLSRRRLTIARRLVEAQHTAAMLTTFNEVDMTAVMAIRKRRREAFQERYGVSLGFMSFFTRAAIGALKAFPPVNAELQGDELVLKQYYDVGIAIGVEEGLVVPVLRDADRMTFAQIEREIG